MRPGRRRRAAPECRSGALKRWRWQPFTSSAILRGGSAIRPDARRSRCRHRSDRLRRGSSTSRHRRPARRVGLMGISQGGQVALLAAAGSAAVAGPTTRRSSPAARHRCRRHRPRRRRGRWSQRAVIVAARVGSRWPCRVSQRRRPDCTRDRFAGASLILIDSPTAGPTRRPGLTRPNRPPQPVLGVG